MKRLWRGWGLMCQSRSSRSTLSSAESPFRDKVAKPCERPSANPFHCREAVALKHYVREVARFMLDHGG